MIYALFLVNFEGKILCAQPTGCQFDDAFVKIIYDSESNNPAPHPFTADMGEGFTMIGLFSGKSQPFIILPNHMVGLVIDAAEDQENIKKNLRKLTNNILLVRRENQDNLDSYLENLWIKVSEKQWDAIILEKPKAVEPTLSPLPKPPSIPSPSNVPANDDFKDLLSLQNQTIGSHQENPFADDPFSGKNQPANAFGIPIADPFGGSLSQSTSPSKSDPFGSSSSPSTPSTPSIPVSKGTDLKYKPELFGEVKSKDSVSIDEFSENPFASENSQSSSSGDADLFSDNPFEEEKPKKKEKSADPFADDPFK